MHSGNASLGFISIFRDAGSKINDLILRNLFAIIIAKNK